MADTSEKSATHTNAALHPPKVTATPDDVAQAAGAALLAVAMLYGLTNPHEKATGRESVEDAVQFIGRLMSPSNPFQEVLHWVAKIGNSVDPP